MTRPVTVFLSVAEESGDLHAGPLMRALRDRLGEVRFIGAAGKRMAAEGCEVVEDLTDRASMLGGPILKLGYYLRVLRRLRNTIRTVRPDVVVPVDSPALNWHVAKAARKAGIPVFYYIAPQVWGWGTWRVRKLARLTDGVGCILPFEQRYLRQRGVQATFVGHPLVDHIADRPETPPDLAEAWLEGTWKVALLPGSRPGEIRKNTPLLRAAAQAITARWPKARCTFAAHSPQAARSVGEIVTPDDPCDIVESQTHRVLAESHVALAVSGTVTLEAACFGLPMVVLYRTSWFERLAYRLVVRHLIRTRFISLVNILAQRQIVPELVPLGANPKPLIRTVMDVMNDYGYLYQVRRQLLELVEPLGSDPRRPASENAADLIAEMIHRQPD